MKVSENEILIIYNSNIIQDREALGYAKTLKDHEVREMDVQKDSFTELQLKSIADQLGVAPSSLINKLAATYIRDFGDSEISSESALQILKENPDILKTPIAIQEDSAEFLESPYTLVKRDMVSPSITTEAANQEEQAASAKS